MTIIPYTMSDNLAHANFHYSSLSNCAILDNSQLALSHPNHLFSQEVEYKG